jgi:uncharacterized protein (TIGR02265 family)
MPASEASPAPASLHIAGNAFQGLFVRALPPEPAFHADLKALGVDVERLLPQYPLRVWREAMAVARRHFFAGHTQQQADWLLGRLFLQGFLDTMAGRSSGGMVLPVIGPAGMVENIQRGFSMSRPDMRVTVQVVGETERCLLFEDAQPLPEFAAGCVEVALERARVRAEVTVEDRTATSYVLRVRW